MVSLKNSLLICIAIALKINVCECQTTSRPEVQPAARSGVDCICPLNVARCKCTFVVEYRLSMVHHEERLLVVPDNGYLKTSGSYGQRINDTLASRIITTDGVGSRLVIAINGTFPGPRVEVYENQEIEITFINTFHTDSITVHFHGIHQRNTPWMDGVAFVTQCPILPGQKFTYRFNAYPPGTSMYHAHIGDQRSMGLYGPFIVRKRDTEPFSEIVIALQDWNHLMDSETAYLRMITEQYNFGTGEKIPTTYSVDGAKFSRFEFQSGLINGKGRYWSNRNYNNGAPLERFKVKYGQYYRFRVIGAMTLYPMRIYIQGPTVLNLRSSDCYNLKNQPVQSIIIHPGERYDFNAIFQNQNNRKEYLLVAETLEDPASHGGFHVAEAVIEAIDSTSNPNPNPPNDEQETCSSDARCLTFNCPYGNAGTDTRSCINFNQVQNTDSYRDPTKVLGNRVDNEYFFNFGFPGFPSNSPGSVNGREFEFPPSPLLTQLNLLTTSCDNTLCRRLGICKCTYVVDVPGNKLIQMTFMNIGKGSGWSHPVHLHGTSFFVMKIGLGTYDMYNGRLITETTDTECMDRFGFCSDAKWRNDSWNQGNIPDLNKEPALKDTIVVPTGGYVVVRFISDNPGMWFLHCHIDMHNTNGMAMVINVDPANHPAPPEGFPRCGNFEFIDKTPSKTGLSIGYVILVIIGVVCLMFGLFFGGLCLKKKGKCGDCKHFNKKDIDGEKQELKPNEQVQTTNC